MAVLDELTKSLVEVYASKLNQQEQQELMQALEIIADDLKYNHFRNFFPDTGEFRRELYPRHISFFKAGNKYRQRAFVAGNRVGKTEAGAFETVCHATGEYPDWWEGVRFTHPVLVWVGGDTAITLRDITQKKLLGETNDIGSGMLPKASIAGTKTRRNVPDAIETITVNHKSGGTSTIVMKSYEQGRIAWQGTEVDFIWLDEECPMDVYGEAQIRLMTTNGSLILTFTPLSGLTDLVVSFLDHDQDSDDKHPKHVTTCGWEHVPHISESMKEEMLAGTLPQLREARSKGVPTVGSGLIYPVDPKNIVIDDFKIPAHWMKAYAMDVGWNNTAAIFGAWDRENDVIYLYSEHKQGEVEPIIHAQAIKARGKWIKGVVDPAARGRSQVDGQQLFQIYALPESRGGLGLKLTPANNAIEAGIYEVWQRLSTGRLKIFKSCPMLIREFSLYHRDDKGQIVKKNDHLMDCMRYLCLANKNVWTYPADDNAPNKVVEIKNYMQGFV
jgi:phage terminase large subunit-like protein